MHCTLAGPTMRSFEHSRSTSSMMSPRDSVPPLYEMPDSVAIRRRGDITTGSPLKSLSTSMVYSVPHMKSWVMKHDVRDPQRLHSSQSWAMLIPLLPRPRRGFRIWGHEAIWLESDTSEA